MYDEILVLWKQFVHNRIGDTKADISFTLMDQQTRNRNSTLRLNLEIRDKFGPIKLEWKHKLAGECDLIVLGIMLFTWEQGISE